MTREPRIIVVGTDYRGDSGGIAIALKGLVGGLQRTGLYHGFVVSHRDEASGAWRPVLSAIPELHRQIRAVQAEGYRPIVYGHAGEGYSQARIGALLALARAAGAHTMLQLHPPNILWWSERRRSRWPLKAALRHPHRVCVLTPFWAQFVRTLGVEASVVPDPLPPFAEAEAAKALGATRPDGPIRLLTMCRLVPNKGPTRVLEALRLLPPEFHWVVAGDGPIKETLIRSAEEYGLTDRITMAGWVRDEAKCELIRSCDAFVLPSTFDSFGMGYVETMAFGLPQVGLRWGPIPDVVPDGKVGYLADNDPESIAAAILRLSDAEHRRALGQAAKRWVLDEFSSDSVARKAIAAIPG